MSTRQYVASFISRWRLRWAILTVVWALVAFPVTIVLFPGSNLWLALIVCMQGFFGSMTAVADLITDEDDT